MKPILSGGVCPAASALPHSIAFWSSHRGVPLGSIKQVNPFVPVCKVLEEPSACGMVIVALFTMDAGAAVFTLAMYSGSVFGTSSVGNSNAKAEVTEIADAATNAKH